MKTSKILLPLDGTEVALKALLPAKSLARILNGYVHIIHISDEPLSQEELLRKVKVDPKEIQEFIIAQKKGDRAEIILEEGKFADYIVICNNKNDIINPVTLKVLEKSSKPVLLVKPNTVIEKDEGIWLPSNILMPLDGTIESTQILDATFEIIRNAHSSIDAIHIFDLEKDMNEKIKPPYYEDHPSQDWASWSKEFVKLFCPCCLPNTKIKLYLSKKDPGLEIINLAEKNKNDLIALAWKGKLSEGHGNVLKQVIKEVQCPILLYKIVPGKQFIHTCNS